MKLLKVASALANGMKLLKLPVHWLTLWKSQLKKKG